MNGWNHCLCCFWGLAALFVGNCVDELRSPFGGLELRVMPDANQFNRVASEGKLMLVSSVIRAEYYVEDFGLFLDFPVGLHTLHSLKLKDLVNSVETSKVDSLLLAFSGVTDADLDVLKQFPALKRLDLGGTKVTNIGIPIIVETEGLRDLFLNDTRIDDNSNIHLEALKDLRVLSLGGTDLSLSKALKLLDGSKIEVLFVPGLQNSGAIELSSDSLIVLDIAFSDLSMVTFDNVPRLETLVISKSQLAGISAHLHRAPSLKSIVVVDDDSTELNLNILGNGSVSVLGRERQEFYGANMIFREVNPALLYDIARK